MKFRCKKKKKTIDQFLTNQIEKASKIVPLFPFMQRDNKITYAMACKNIDNHWLGKGKHKNNFFLK